MMLESDTRDGHCHCHGRHSKMLVAWDVDIQNRSLSFFRPCKYIEHALEWRLLGMPGVRLFPDIPSSGVSEYHALGNGVEALTISISGAPDMRIYLSFSPGFSCKNSTCRSSPWHIWTSINSKPCWLGNPQEKSSSHGIHKATDISHSLVSISLSSDFAPSNQGKKGYEYAKTQTEKQEIHEGSRLITFLLGWMLYTSGSWCMQQYNDEWCPVEVKEDSLSWVQRPYLSHYAKWVLH